MFKNFSMKLLNEAMFSDKQMMAHTDSILMRSSVLTFHNTNFHGPESYNL